MSDSRTEAQAVNVAEVKTGQVYVWLIKAPNGQILVGCGYDTLSGAEQYRSSWGDGYRMALVTFDARGLSWRPA